MYILRNIRDESDIMDLDDHSLARSFFPLPVDKRRLFVIGGEAKRVEGAALPRDRLLRRFSRVHGVLIVLEVTIGVVIVVLGLLIIVDRFGEIFRLRFRVLSGQYFEKISHFLRRE